MTLRQLPRLRPLALAASALVATGAFAQATPSDPNPYFIGVTESLTHDSNVYRLPGGGPSDTYASTGLVGGFDQSIGRQHFSGGGNIRYNKYKRDASQDNISYGLNAGWDWSTIERFSGGVNVSANQSLATNSGNSILPTTDKNVVRSDQISTSLRYGGYGRFTLGGDYSHSRVRFSAAQYFASESSSDSLGASLGWNLNPDVTFGIGYRVTSSDSPYGLQTGPGTYDDLSSRGRNIDLTASYRYTALTSLNARLSFSRQSNPGGAGNDFSGLTGSLNANYQATGKIGLNLSASRDAGTNGNYFNGVVVQQGTNASTNYLVLSQYSQVSNSVSVGANYAATAKIGANASYTYRQSRLSNSVSAGGFATNGDTRDNLHVGSIGASYTALRWLSLACSLSHESRNVSSTPPYSYGANVVSCSAQAALR